MISASKVDQPTSIESYDYTDTLAHHENVPPMIKIAQQLENEFNGDVLLLLFGSSTYLDPKDNSYKPSDNDLLLVINNPNILQATITFLSQYFSFPAISMNDLETLIFDEDESVITFFDLSSTYNGRESTIRIILAEELLKSLTHVGLESKYRKVIQSGLLKPIKGKEVSMGRTTQAILVDGTQTRVPITMTQLQLEDSYYQILYENKENGVYVMPRLLSLALSLYEDEYPEQHKAFAITAKLFAISFLKQLMEKFASINDRDFEKFLVRHERFSNQFRAKLRHLFTGTTVT